jgi:hypothetical protein
MAKMTFTSRGGRIQRVVVRDRAVSDRSAEDLVRQMKQDQQKPPGEDYRERALALFGLICARCSREFADANRQLLTVHHKDGNHFNNPPDGSNWEMLCVYCHEDVHSRGMLGDYLDGSPDTVQADIVYSGGDINNEPAAGLGVLGEKLKQALGKKDRSRS